MKRIFISYSRTDEAFATGLANALRDVRADVWIDTEDIPAGEKWSTAIQGGLDSSDAMLVVISPDAMESSNVEDEWQYFMDRGNPVIPVLWQPAKMHFQLHRLQYIDFYGQPFGEAFAKLLDELARRGIALDVAEAEETWAMKRYDLKRDTDRLANIDPQLIPDAPTPEADAEPRTNYLSLLLGIAIMVAFAGLLGVPFLIGLSPDDIRYAPPQSPIWLTGIVGVHADPTGNSGTFNLVDPAIVGRSFTEGDTWYQLQGRDQTGFQVADFLADDIGNDRLLDIVPYESVLPETRITLYTRPNADDPSSIVDVDTNALFYGYTIDEAGAEWFRVEVYSETHNDSIIGWMALEEVPVNDLGTLPVIAATTETTDGWRDPDQDAFEMRVRSNTEMRVLDVVDDLAYGGIFQDNAWWLIWIAAEDLNISELAADDLR